MIITKQKEKEAIIDLIKDKKNLFLVGCGECATTCKTGGEEQIAAMKAELEKSGKTVTGWVIPDSTCVASQVKMSMAKHQAELKKSDAVLVFACGSGTQSFKENDRLGLDVFSGNDSLFAGVVDAKGDFKEVCSACGECVLEFTEGLCPITRCPKGMLNGPCGGIKNGKCEVDKTRDCIWVLIYKIKAQKKATKDLSVIRKPRDYKKSLKPSARKA